MNRELQTIIVEVEKALDHEVHEMEHDIQADVDAVMKKYDRESNTRIWEGAPKIALRVLMSAFSIYCILMTLFSKALPERRLSLFLGFIIIIGYLVYPARKGAARVNHVPWYDWLLMVLGAGSFFYFAINAFSIIQLATKLQPIHIIVGAIGIVVPVGIITDDATKAYSQYILDGHAQSLYHFNNTENCSRLTADIPLC